MLVFLFHSPSIPDEWVVSLSLHSKQETDRRERGMAASPSPCLSLLLSPKSLWAALRHSHGGLALPPPAAPTSLLFTSINEP